MLPSRDEALSLLHEFTQSESLRKHALAVEAAMRAFARRFRSEGGMAPEVDEHYWGLVGLLHDFDYERYPEAPDHPLKGSEILAERGYPEDFRRAILSHASYTGVSRERLVEKVLFSVDELSGFITAVTLVRPRRALAEVDPKAVRKKLKDKAFARSVNREEVFQGIEELGTEFDPHVAFVIEAMRGIERELGLAGVDAPASARFGSWKSPITADQVAVAGVRLGGLRIDGSDIYWIEGRPQEGGRNVIVRRTPDGGTADVTPPGFNVRTRVHEYGGGSYAVRNGTVYFSNYSDQRLYRQERGGTPVPITPETSLRFADAVFEPAGERLICVREDHTRPSVDPLGVNEIVALRLEGDEQGGQVLVSGKDFYANPRLSPDGTRLAWLTWDYPDMPWDGTELWVGEIGPDGTVRNAQRVAGSRSEAVFQPEWSPDGVLHFISDPSGWWNLYRWNNGEVEPLYPMEAEFGLPLWVFDRTTYSFESASRIFCSYRQEGLSRLAVLETDQGRLNPLETPFTEIENPQWTPLGVIFLGRSPAEPSCIVLLDPWSGALRILKRSSEAALDRRFLSLPEPIEFPTEGGLSAHGFYYSPRNPEFTGTEGELPPLLVISHGGPTSANSAALSLEMQFWTSRGFAVLDVNYGGSTGYGRVYRERLDGQWGVVDVDDCENGARYLVNRGLVDSERLAIRGGSAGGYTTLCALTFRTLFRAGADYYGVSDLRALDEDSHKFESRYNERLVGPYPERADLYRSRSPIFFVDRISCPVIFFQGLDDPVVPPAQSEMMYEAIRAKGLPTAYLAFEGEQHGFRRAENIIRTLEAELYFYGKVFGFEPADPIPPVEIANLP